MPVMDGVTATRLIHEQSDNKALSVIAVSASVSDATRESAGSAGVCDFISKPVRFSELFSKVYRWIGEGADTQHGKTCDTDYTDVSLEGVEMMLSGISACLDIGDVSSLNDLAEQWSTNNKGLGHYPGQIKQSCGALDLTGLESIREELLGRLRAADRSREVNNDE